MIEAQSETDIRRLGVCAYRLLHRASGQVALMVGRVYPVEDPLGVCQGELRVGQREHGIELHGALELLQSTIQVLRREVRQMHEVPAAEIRLIRIQVFCGSRLDPCELLRRQLGLERQSNLPRDVALN